MPDVTNARPATPATPAATPRANPPATPGRSQAPAQGEQARNAGSDELRNGDFVERNSPPPNVTATPSNGVSPPTTPLRSLGVSPRCPG